MPTTRTGPEISITTTDHPNALVVREAFAAFGRGDLDIVRGSLAEGASWANAGSGPLAGTYRGWDDIAAMFMRLFDLTGGSVGMTLVSVLADDEHAVALYDATSTVAGRTATHRFALIQEMTPDGRARSTQNLAYDQAAADAHLAAAL